MNRALFARAGAFFGAGGPAGLDRHNEPQHDPAGAQTTCHAPLTSPKRLAGCRQGSAVAYHTAHPKK